MSSGGLQNERMKEMLMSVLIQRGFMTVSRMQECSYRGFTAIQDNSDGQNDQK